MYKTTIYTGKTMPHRFGALLAKELERYKHLGTVCSKRVGEEPDHLGRVFSVFEWYFIAKTPEALEQMKGVIDGVEKQIKRA